jgi:hypothetical protein
MARFGSVAVAFLCGILTTSFYNNNIIKTTSDTTVVENADRTSSSTVTGDKRNLQAKKSYFSYDDKDGYFRKKTQSYMPYMPSLDGHMKTHDTYRFITIREQVMTVIGEAKHGLWRVQDTGIVRLYRKHEATGVPVGADVYQEDLQDSIKNDYKANLIPGVETSDEEGWAGYRYAQDDDGDGQAAFVDVPIYHPVFGGVYDDHPVIDLPHFICSMSTYNYPKAKKIWDYAKVQPNANVIGPLGIRAGLDIKELYTSAIKLDLLPDAKIWIQIGQNKHGKNVFDQADIDSGRMKMDVRYRALDASKTDYEIYLVERTSWNVPYLQITVVVDNKENDELSYVRPDGLYWDKLLEKGLTDGVKTEMTYDPKISIIDDNGMKRIKTVQYTPLSAMNVLDGYGYGNWCPQKGGDWADYPDNPSGAGWPNQYEEATPICDGIVVDIKLYGNLDVPSWDLSSFQLQNAGSTENPQTYIGLGNQYGDFTDPYLVDNGIVNPHALHFTEESNPSKKPIQGIEVKFDQVGITSKYVDPESGETIPRKAGLNKAQKKERERRKSLITFP